MASTSKSFIDDLDDPAFQDWLAIGSQIDKVKDVVDIDAAEIQKDYMKYVMFLLEYTGFKPMLIRQLLATKNPNAKIRLMDVCFLISVHLRGPSVLRSGKSDKIGQVMKTKLKRLTAQYALTKAKPTGPRQITLRRIAASYPDLACKILMMSPTLERPVPKTRFEKDFVIAGSHPILRGPYVLTLMSHMNLPKQDKDAILCAVMHYMILETEILDSRPNLTFTKMKLNDKLNHVARLLRAAINSTAPCNGGLVEMAKTELGKIEQATMLSWKKKFISLYGCDVTNWVSFPLN